MQKQYTHCYNIGIKVIIILDKKANKISMSLSSKKTTVFIYLQIKTI